MVASRAKEQKLLRNGVMISKKQQTVTRLPAALLKRYTFLISEIIIGRRAF